MIKGNPEDIQKGHPLVRTRSNCAKVMRQTLHSVFPNACEVTHSVCVCVLGNSTWTTTTSTPFDVALRRLVTHQTREKAKWARPHLGQDWGCCHIFENWAFILPSFRLRLHSSNRSQSRTRPPPLPGPHILSSLLVYLHLVRWIGDLRR